MLASVSSADAPSMLSYRAFEAWAPGSDWTVSLPAGEEAQSVAVGASFCAVATSARLLRVYSAAGVRFASAPLCSTHCEGVISA
jgi:chromosome transmission fidelity protein 4